MRSEGHSRWPRVGLGLLAAVFLVAGGLLAVAEYRYIAFRQTLQQLQFDVRLVDFDYPTPQQARLRWIVTVRISAPKVAAFLELLDWHVRSPDESVHLGYYTSGEIQVPLTAEAEIPLEATIAGPNFEKLHRLLEESPQQELSLLFRGTARVMFQLPRAEERKKIPVVSFFTLPKEHP